MRRCEILLAFLLLMFVVSSSFAGVEYVVGNDTGSMGAQKGQGMVEYAIIIAFVVAISVVLIGVRPELAQGIGAIAERAASFLGSF